MRNIISYPQLRERAEEILNNEPKQNKIISYNDIYLLTKELDLKKIELDLLMQELLNKNLEITEVQTYYSHLYNFVPFAYFTYNKQGNIFDLNEASENLLELEKSDLIGKNLCRYIAPSHQYYFIQHCENVINSNKLQTCELRLLKKHSTSVYIQLTSKTIENTITKEKNIISFVSALNENQGNNLTYLPAEPHQDGQNELASIMAHELNHPFSVINNYLHGCIRRIESKNFNEQEILHALQRAVEQSKRISDVILRMKNLTPHATIQFEAVDINDLISYAIAFVQQENAHKKIEFKFTPLKNLPLGKIDKVHIEQVIINLFRNSMDALRDNKIENPVIIIEATQISVREIEVSVLDNGPGIPDEDMHKLFSPYFSTKTYGLGLGLVICEKIINTHQGKLTIEKDIFARTCFKFTLPIHIEPQGNNKFYITRKKRHSFRIKN